jgi:DHA1 family tetracycline resistance protein-like MFS transporter
MVGLTLAAVGVCTGVVQGVLVRPLVARFGERGSLYLGLLCGAVGFTTYGLAASGSMFWLGIPIMSFWGLSNPAVQGLMSGKVGASDQGQLQGAVGSLRGISGLIGPTLFTQTFALFLSPRAPVRLPGAPFVLAGLLLFTSFTLAVSFVRRAHAAVATAADV